MRGTVTKLPHRLTGGVKPRCVKRFDQIVVVLQVEEYYPETETKIWRDANARDLQFLSIKGELNE